MDKVHVHKRRMRIGKASERAENTEECRDSENTDENRERMLRWLFWMLFAVAVGGALGWKAVGANMFS